MDIAGLGQQGGNQDISRPDHHMREVVQEAEEP